jgi:hypothetical protein
MGMRHIMILVEYSIFPNYVIETNVIWHIYTLLGNDRETDEKTVVARQRPVLNIGNTVGGGDFHVLLSEAV